MKRGGNRDFCVASSRLITTFIGNVAVYFVGGLRWFVLFRVELLNLENHKVFLCYSIFICLLCVDFLFIYFCYYFPCYAMFCIEHICR